MSVIKGKIYSDNRGIVRFVNDFNLDGIKRFYTITHPETSTIRAWQGHKQETKCFYPISGSFLINWIRIDNWEQPSRNLSINKHILSNRQSEILVVPRGYVTGFKALVPDSAMIVFSDMLLEDSKNDDYRFPQDFWDLELR